MGMKHTGKSQHGAALADAIDYAFCDTDSLIQELDSAESGMRRTIRDIYLEDGVERFRQLEAAACRLAVERDAKVVVATGGGVCDNPPALEATAGGFRVHLVDSEDALATRVFRGGIPGFLHTRDRDVARRRFAELYERRVAAYEELADITIDLRGASLADARTQILSTIEEYLRGRK